MTARRVLFAAAMAATALAMPVVEERQSCNAQWAQCGGTGWTGSTCCASGSTCVYSNDYYSQCIPGAAASSSSSASSSKASSSSASASKTSSSSASKTSSTASSTTKPPVGASSTASYSGNPFTDVSMWANSFYASEVSASAIPSLSGAQATAAAAAAKVPNFQWIDTRDKVSVIGDSLADIRTANKAGGTPNAGLFVVYDLPDRDCAAAASNGEYTVANNGVALYKEYIDAIRALLIEYSDVRTILVIEPDSLANLVTNLSVSKCANAQAAYLECVNYAIKQLNLANVAMYLDAGHVGWLGWPANLSPAAQLFGSVYKNASSPAAVRGLATNVANYNGWSLTSAPSYTQGNSLYDEKSYIEALGPLVAAQGFSAHFITDQGRSGVQPTGQLAWGDWCNVIDTGFGIRPTTDTGVDLADAIVWVKPGGECDGTSDSTAARYDYHCGLSDALQPSPEAGSWFQAYFVQLLKNANPAF